jgi:hypothetical protein
LRWFFAGERQHLVRHIEPIGFASRRDAPCRQQHVDAPARAEVEHGFARLELRQSGRIAAAQ